MEEGDRAPLACCCGVRCHSRLTVSRYSNRQGAGGQRPLPGIDLCCVLSHPQLKPWWGWGALAHPSQARLLLPGPGSQFCCGTALHSGARNWGQVPSLWAAWVVPQNDSPAEWVDRNLCWLMLKLSVKSRAPPAVRKWKGSLGFI